MPHGTAPRRRTRLAAAGLLAALGCGLAAGCGSPVTPQEKAAQCAGLAQDVTLARLSGPVERDAVKASAESLDARITQMRDPSVHDAAVALHTHLHALETALEKGDAGQVRRLTDTVREDVTDAASACSLPESAFLGG